jgi:YVTN family beta-propeller protein
MAVTPDGSTLYVAPYGSGHIDVIDTATATVQPPITFPWVAGAVAIG